MMRKNMYYNMRIKTINRTLSTLIKLAEKAFKVKLDGLNEDLANLFLKMNELREEQMNKLKELRISLILVGFEIKALEKIEMLDNLAQASRRGMFINVRRGTILQDVEDKVKTLVFKVKKQLLPVIFENININSN